MKYIKIYSLIVVFFLLHIIFNIINKNNISEINPATWLILLASLGGFIWSIIFVRKSDLKHKFITYILSSFGILFFVAQVLIWYLFKDIGF